jgi:class 3 adenylate cyclase
MSNTSSDAKPFDKTGFQPLNDKNELTEEKKVTFGNTNDYSDDEAEVAAPRAKKITGEDQLDAHDDPLVSETVRVDAESEELWPSPLEEILRGEFSEFQRYKQIRPKGPDYVMMVHRSRLTLHNYFYVIISSFFVVASLFLHNLRIACCDRTVDLGFDIALLAILALLVFDFVINLIGSPAYLISFDFWTDIASMIVLIFDLQFVREPLYRLDHTAFKVGVSCFYYILDIVRLARLTKIIRFYFLRKYVYRYQYFMKFFELDEEDARMLANEHLKHADGDEDAKDLELIRKSSMRRRSGGTLSRAVSDVKRAAGSLFAKSSNAPKVRLSLDGEQAAGGEIVGGFSRRHKMKRQKRKRKFRTSRISHRILYLTTKRVIFTIMILFIVLPLMSLSFYYPPAAEFTTDMSFLKVFNNQTMAADYLNTIAVPLLDSKHTPLISAMWNGALLNNTKSLTINAANLRDSEMTRSANYGQFGMEVSIRYFIQIQAILNIIRVIFVLGIYFQRLYAYQKDASQNIMTPIDRLLDKVKLMAKNPSQALNMAQEYREMQNSDLAVIEDVIQKMAYLLVLGFGEAGNSILSKVLTISKDLQVDYLGKPNTVHAIFGFCDIRSFTDVTEILVDDVLNFVNSIAKIVHTEVGENQGGANKNIGDAFLVVWRLKGKDKSNIEEFTRPTHDPSRIKSLHSIFRRLDRRASGVDDRMSSMGNGVTLLPEGFLQELSYPATHDHRRMTMDEYEERRANNLSNSSVAELSLISFLRIMAQMVINPVIRKYNSNKRINKGLPGYKVNLGFGLHAGSAIEGAIGSTLKIDMSYLSHNVNMAPRLEGLTKVYKVPLLFTSSLFNMFNTPKLREICRRVDRIYINGTIDYYDLFTVDIYNQELEEAYDLGKVSKEDRYGISIPENEDDFEVEQRSAAEDKNGYLKSERDLRMDNFSHSYITNERRLEMSLIKSVVPDQKEEDQYIPYDEVQRMWEFLIGDKPTSILIGQEARSEIRQRRDEMANIYSTGVNYYLDAEGPKDAEKWGIARREFENLLAKSDRDSRYIAVYEYMKSCEFTPPEDFQKGRQTE